MAKEIIITLPDGSKMEVEKGITLQEIAKKIGSNLAKDALAGKINGKPVDLNTPILEDSAVEIVTFSSPEGPDIYRHSTSHVMAQAVRELYPEAKFGIGPAIEDGFYYDFDLKTPFTPDDLAKIEKQMKKIIKRNLPFTSEELPKEKAIKFFKSINQDYKIELINGIDGNTVRIYRNGDFTDLCRGPHLPSTGKIKAFKLLSVAGAYWRGDEKRPMLQRIYGTVFNDSKKLEEYLYKQKEATRRDHRKLGKELDLFSIHDDFGAGLVLWHPKGALIRKIIEDFWRDEHLKRGYEMVMTPHIAKVGLWKTSGHWDFYRENMYSPMKIEEQEYVVKPMNCPAHILIYKSKTRSYRELPLRWAELGTVYRYERSGVLHGLLRVRGFTQDDAHIFCRPEQIEDEILKILDIILHMLRTFGFNEYEIYVSTRPDKYVGTLEHWEQATTALEKALNNAGLNYQIDPGEGVFYGPKIDIKIKDALGRAWQCSTVQVDFNIPERFDITYMGEDNREHRPIMIHRAILGSIERFMGCLIEHYVGAFPTWLAPVQVVVLPIADRHNDYANKVVCNLLKSGIRAEVDLRSESVNKKIRDSQVGKVPHMIIVGDNEIDTQTISVRARSGEDKRGLLLKKFLDDLFQEINKRL
ncbi:threonine--tRNA ligase [Candidatus Oleimmundimicrobium sp.]|uniref:threonine--tRNA ligase n=1 Tax=Candidatus Oleimmundimicrobium sp. TaxID=3060597 RepID=UPI002727C932|nr:threonine--tRNA ligase [Candidatus Oleimmundimicrobium sp.]MDO8885547.1 threonine--tRNA ligase [Candidatus Oleimmundimicrobium sp.]